jgi:hypothetical protein
MRVDLSPQRAGRDEEDGADAPLPTLRKLRALKQKWRREIIATPLPLA